ncbi:DUF1345 domain-containing protein [Galbitalea soli]|uniref:DUF1345 domain-containing protein n=1 Tax=Galbitalea soli TaxID=1268042 RepID=A0A7C9PLK0_9MICO|nr:DUF1345 domain-containing protein [Galbitalea soli]NEM90312.1 DUF1345 domain-containing protein [Galbitalea soli]NYJ31020.1 putative membrane protein [Galbitalea soli]
MRAEAPPGTRTEHRWPVVTATVFALVLYVLLPDTLQPIPRWVIPTLGIAAILPLVVLNPRRLDRETEWSRWLSIVFSVLLTLANQAYVVALVIALVAGNIPGPTVLLTALQVWVTSVIAFALVYWEMDRGGAVARRIEGYRDDATQDFRFPQQDNGIPTNAWEPAFVDYAYFALSNMMAFSPTDVMPLTHRAKLVMGYQALTGFILLALVISRAVNILH